jgi:hypothetical protein
MGAMTVGADLVGSNILAGVLLGTNRALGGGDDVFQLAAEIAAVTVKGQLSQSSIAAGVDPVNGIFGDGDDVLAAAPGGFDVQSAIKKVVLAGNQLGAAAPVLAHSYAIEAGVLGSLSVAGESIENPTFPLFLDVAPAGEDAADIILRVLP